MLSLVESQSTLVVLTLVEVHRLSWCDNAFEGEPAVRAMMRYVGEQRRRKRRESREVCSSDQHIAFVVLRASEENDGNV